MSDVEVGTKDPWTPSEESPNKKHKPDVSDEAAAAGKPSSSTKGRFKIVGKVVMAMRRFQGMMRRAVWHSSTLSSAHRQD